MGVSLQKEDKKYIVLFFKRVLGFCNFKGGFSTDLNMEDI